MGLFEQFPYTNYHDLNLDWIIQKVKEAYSPDNPPENVVLSVNGETGAVVLYTDAVVQLPTVEEGTWNIFRKANNSDEGIQFIKGQPAQRISGTNRYNIYDQGNQPPYPVTSVDGSTGAVTTWANTGSDNITLPREAEGDSWTLRREGPSGYLGIEFDLDESDNPSGYFILKPEGQTLQKIKILTPADIPSESGVISVNGEAGVVVLYAGDIALASDNATTVKAAIEGANTKIGQNQAIIAYPENGSTSSTNYSVGQYIARNGSLYKVIANISSGDQFTGSNISAVDNIGYEITALISSLTETSSSVSGTDAFTPVANSSLGSYNKIIKKKNAFTSTTILTLNLSFTGNISSWTSVATIKNSNYFPSIGINAPLTSDPTATVFINTDGTITINKNVTTTDFIHLTVTY